MDSIHILVAVTDSALASDFVRQLKAALGEIESVFAVATDGKRALADFKAERPQIVIASSDLPGIDGAKLAHEIAKISGETSIFVLGSAVPDVVYDTISLPIVNWQKTILRIQSALPEHVKVRLGIEERDVELIAALKAYGKKYLKSETTIVDAPPLVLIPAFSQSQMASVAPPVAANAPRPLNPQSDEQSIQMKAAPSVQASSIMAVDLIVTIALVSGAILCHWYSDSERIVSIKNTVTVLAALSLFGLTLGRSLERLARVLK